MPPPAVDFLKINQVILKKKRKKERKSKRRKEKERTTDDEEEEKKEHKLRGWIVLQPLNLCSGKTQQISPSKNEFRLIPHLSIDCQGIR